MLITAKFQKCGSFLLQNVTGANAQSYESLEMRYVSFVDATGDHVQNYSILKLRHISSADITDVRAQKYSISVCNIFP